MKAMTRIGNGANPNHHLWNNHGTWFLHYTEYPTPVTKQRVRRSLKTKSLAVARQRRDDLLARLGSNPVDAAQPIQAFAA